MKRSTFAMILLLTLAVFAPMVKSHAEKKVVKNEVVGKSIEVSETFTATSISDLVFANLDCGVYFVIVIQEAKPENSTPIEGFATLVFRPPLNLRQSKLT